MARKIDVYVVPFMGVDINFTLSNGIIAYQFSYNGQNYGQALNILTEGKKRATIDSAVKGGGVLMLNAIESITQLINQNNDK